MANKETFYCEFSKYDRNLQHAMAVNTIGNRLDYWIRDAEGDIERIKEQISEKIAEKSNDADWVAKEDWTIKNLEQDLINFQETLAIWKKLDAVLEKELAF